MKRPWSSTVTIFLPARWRCFRQVFPWDAGHEPGPESGQDLVEYALIAALLALAALTLSRALPSALGSIYNAVGSTLTVS